MSTSESSASSIWWPSPRAPKPPAREFRTIKLLSHLMDTSSGWLCLPRSLPAPFESASTVDEEFLAENTEKHAILKALLNARNRQQLWLLEFPRVADCLIRCINANGVSDLKQEHVSMMPHLVVVKTAQKPERLRKQADIIEALHRDRGEGATLHIGSVITGSNQFTSDPTSSWMSLRPIFGPSLEQLGEASRSLVIGGLPPWFIGHVCIELIEALDFMHANGLAHEKVLASNIFINLYPSCEHYRFRGFPDIQLTDFVLAKSIEDGGSGNVTGLLHVIDTLTSKWGDLRVIYAEDEWGTPLNNPTENLWRQVRDLLAEG
ncbi:hypothetical protein T440DRAFT_91831 [Plenodomus tracheiphilus IPT5]|uniref:Protein kinase domain-containing protein n=1 Tax=Plenodomus tracheiphilus IPT5 TaxID=1408161 RepID=A0A6A7B574_9PLEO|nr:hypothetical protein T440DRAFT_91831 [Plenodomus tracheiphilus IPT5]